MKNISRIIVYLLLVTFQPIFGQLITHENALVSRENWLPNRTINAIFQDSEGLLWVGTTNGLYQYDGEKVKHFTTQPNKQNAIFTNLVEDIDESGNGDIIVALESGLSSYNKQTGFFTTLSNKIQNYRKIWRDKDNKLWFVIGNLGSESINRVDQQTTNGIKTIVSSQNSQKLGLASISDFQSLSQNSLMVVTTKGIYKLNHLNFELSDLNFYGEFTSSLKLNSQEYLLGTKASGLVHVRFRNNTFEILGNYHFGDKSQEGHDDITSLSKGKNGEIVVSTVKNLYQGLMEGGKLRFSPLITDTDILEDNNIITSFIDQSGVYWVGTLRGLYKIRPNVLAINRLRIELPSYTLVNQNINFLFKENSNRFWIGTQKDGFFTLNPKTVEFSKIEFEKPIKSIYQSSKGYFIANSSSEVFRFNSSKNKNKYKLDLLASTSNGITCGLEVVPGEWWFGCNSKGLIKYRDNGNKQFDSLFSAVNKNFNPVSTIFTMLLDSKRNVWIGSKGDGLLKVNLNSGKIKKYSGIGIEGEISRRILHLKESKNGDIWISTREGGVYIYKHNEDTFRQFTVTSGLPSNVVCAVAEDSDHNIVISTNNGLAIYQKNGLVPFKSFGEKDGVIFGDFTFKTVIEGEGNDLYFGNSNGLYKIKKCDFLPTEKSKFYWNAVETLSSEVSDLKGNNRNYLKASGSELNNIELSSEDNNFEISFGLLNFNDPRKNAYAYRMKGHLDDWKYILNGEQSVKLLDVLPGDYVFEIKAEDSFGYKLEGIKTLEIRVLPPFWQSKGALVLYFILFCLFLLFSFFLIKRWNQLQRKLKEEESLVAIKDQQMIYFADLSHEIKNRLSLILGPLENALSGKKVNQAVLNNLYQQTFKLKRISDQIMDLRKSEGGSFLLQVEKGDVFESLEKLCLEAQPLAIVRDITLSYHLEEEADEAWYDEELLEIITLNLLNNAIKYTPSGGTVNVKAETVYLEKSDLPDMAPSEGYYLKCRVSDTGIGIPKNEIKSLFNMFYRASNAKHNQKIKGAGIGLSLVGRLIKKHRGFIDVNSEEGDGTRVSFYLPLEKNHFQLNEIKLSGSEIPIIEGVLPEYDQMDHKKSTLLLSDDNEEILSFLDENLQTEFNIVKTVNGRQAWEYLQENSVDLVVSDLSMPEMDGLELMGRLKAHETLKHIPFIILTGRNSHSQKLACIQNGVDDFVDKPFSLELITWRIKALLFNRNLMRTSFSRKISVEPSIEKGISHNEAFIQQVINLIDQHIKSKDLSVEFLAEQCFMSRATFYRKMENLMGSAPSTFIRKYRLKKAAKFLQNGNYYISEVAFQTGFSTPKYFAKCFQKEFGCSPSEYVKTLTDLHSN